MKDDTLIEQYGEHWLKIYSYGFAYSTIKCQQLVEAIFNQVKGFGYSSFKSEYSFLPYLTLGDKIKFKNKDGKLVDSVILRYETNYDEITFEAPSIINASVDYELPETPENIAKKAMIKVDQSNGIISSFVQSTETKFDNIEEETNEINGKLNEVGEAIETINSTMMTQTAEAFEMLFTQTGIEDTVNTIQDMLNDNTTDINTISQYIHFEGGIITLGASDSQSKLIIQKDRISFMTGDSESAYISQNQLYITDSTILRKLQVGRWITQEDEYGNLNTKWVGGAI